jgi:hypothetical protein
MIGAAKFALGISITHHQTSQTIALSQTLMIDRVIDKFGQRDAHSVDTPMVPGLMLECPDKSLPVSSHIAAWIERTLF